MNGCGDLLSLVLLIHPGLGDERRSSHAMVFEVCIDIALSFITILCHLRRYQREDASRAEGRR
jgi:hypothetical protein